jgi:site-specific DNA recombinase
VINAEEAEQVQAIFALYLECSGLITAVQELAKRGWRNKRWQTRKGHLRGGLPFAKGSLHHLLTNVVYRGKVKYKNEVHTGEHEAIVEAKVWQQVQEKLSRKSQSRERLSSGALLKGLLHCRPCGTTMTPTYASKNGGRRYGYYVCTNALQRGRKSCPSRSLPSAAIEEWVIERLRQIAKESEAQALPRFTELGAWESLSVEERGLWLNSWIDRVDYDGIKGKAAISFAIQPTSNYRTGQRKEAPYES